MGCGNSSRRQVDLRISGEDATSNNIVHVKACRLGPLIGLEWTRPRGDRRIDTGDLKGFAATLESAGDALSGLAKVEAQARAKIERRPG
jgi:hypothetical protein